jgi:hypothetical protein
MGGGEDRLVWCGSFVASSFGGGDGGLVGFDGADGFE